MGLLLCLRLSTRLLAVPFFNSDGELRIRNSVKKKNEETSRKLIPPVYRKTQYPGSGESRGYAIFKEESEDVNKKDDMNFSNLRF